jgi:hypothetical protein
MSENPENTEAAEAPQQPEIPQDLNPEQAFNLLVNLARQTKLTYEEHGVVDKAVKMLAERLKLGE